jgi:PAS domain S-box-containing protein
LNGLPSKTTWFIRVGLVTLIAAAGAGVGHIGSRWGAAEGTAAALALTLGAVAVSLGARLRAAERVKKHYRQVLEAAGDGLLGVNERKRITFASTGAERLFGYGPGELLGRPLEMVLTKQPTSATAEQITDTAASDGASPAQERVGIRKDSGEITLECRSGPALPTASGPAATIFLRDVTNGKQTRELLCAREAHLRLVVEQMPAILWTTDTQLRITSTLGAGLAALDLQPEEVIGMSMLECLEQRDAEATPIAAHQKAVRGQSLSYEMEWKGRTFQVRVDPLRRPSRRIVGTVGILVDVTDRKRAEEAQGRLVAILEATPDFVAIAGADNRLTYVNRAARDLLGARDGEDLSGRSLGDLYPDDLRETALAEAIRVASAQGVWSGETVFQGHDGQRVPVSQVMIAHGPAGGPVQFLSAVARDVSERLRLEEQFRQAQKMEAIGTLAGGVAHDFNNMLCAIMGYGEFVLQGLPADSPLREFSQEILKAAERAAGLTRQLLAFGRKQMLVPRTLHLNTLVTDTEKMLRRLIGEDIELRTRLDPALHPVRADAGQVAQVLMNLAVNARDAMPTGGRLTMTTRNVARRGAALRGRPEIRPGAYVLLEVSDTGCGMGPEVQARLFEPFFTTKEVGKGTGLGLATVYGIVKQSGGHVEVDSAPGRGTTFRVYLPRTEEVDDPAAPAAGPANVRGGAETVLLVEDEDGVRNLAGEVLRQKGYQVMEASDGEGALTICRQHPGLIDLLLTDAVMPKMSGFLLARHVRSLRPETRVLFMSGFTDSALVRHGVASGEVDCLLKPFSPAALAQAVRQALDAAQPTIRLTAAERISADFEESWRSGRGSRVPLTE